MALQEVDRLLGVLQSRGSDHGREDEPSYNRRMRKNSVDRGTRARGRQRRTFGLSPPSFAAVRIRRWSAGVTAGTRGGGGRGGTGAGMRRRCGPRPQARGSRPARAVFAGVAARLHHGHGSSMRCSRRAFTRRATRGLRRQQDIRPGLCRATNQAFRPHVIGMFEAQDHPTTLRIRARRRLAPRQRGARHADER